MKLFIKLTVTILIVCILASSTIHLLISHYAKNAKPQSSDVIIVLGCQIWDYSPSWSLEYRLNKALLLYKEGYSDHIIVSGGQGKDEITTEASVMKSWLVKHGVDENNITEEGKSTSTHENIKYSKIIMDKKGYKSAIIVSNDFHVFRSLMLASRHGIEASGGPAPTVAHMKTYYHLREILSVVKSFLIDR